MNQFLNKLIELYKTGKFEEAKKICKQELIKNPKHFETINLLSIIYLQEKNYEKAIDLINKAITIKPNHQALYNNLGVIYKEIENYEFAIKNFKKAIKINSNYSEAHNNIAIVYQILKKSNEALNHYRISIRINPDNPETYYNLGILFFKKNNYKNAIESFKKSLKLNRNHLGALKNRASAYASSHEYLLSNEDYNQIKLLDPKNKDMYDSLIFFNNNKICQWSNYNEDLKKIEKNITNNKTNVDYVNPWKLLLYTDKINIIKQNTENYNKQFSVNKIQKNTFNYSNKEKISIAYYSADFRRHAVSHLIANVLENHNKNKFEVFGFHFSPSTDDDMSIRISKSFDKFFDVRTLTDSQVIEKSKNLEIDIAIDLMGHTFGNRVNIFTKRIAPLQVNYLGNPGSVGRFMDYLIADNNLIFKKYEKFYSEKIIYMPDCYQPHDSNKKINNYYDKKKFNLPEEKFIYCCLNGTYKITPEIFDCWMNILIKTENTVLCLLESNELYKKNIINEVKKKNIDEDRIIFTPLVDYENIFQRFKYCNLFLDTFPYGAHTTASEALSSGLPLLTMAGESFQSRVSFSLLNNLGIKELITYNLKDYEDMAVNLAKNPEQLKKIKDKLYSALKNSNTFNTKVYTENLEKGYVEIYNRFKKKLPPKNVYIK
jgi:predicted O-linked N-acetylglucosamine transferase (SPINDLY family)